MQEEGLVSQSHVQAELATQEGMTDIRITAGWYNS